MSSREKLLIRLGCTSFVLGLGLYLLTNRALHENNLLSATILTATSFVTLVVAGIATHKLITKNDDGHGDHH